MSEEPIKPVENRRPNGTFGPGNNANPDGRPKGKTLKEYQAEKFRQMSDEEKEAFLLEIAPDIKWKMAEGMPSQDTKLSGEVRIGKPLLNGESNGDTNNDSIEEITQAA